MDQRIVVPLDGSKIGEAALAYVEDLVSKLSPEVKTEVVLLQVVSAFHYLFAAGRAANPVPYTLEEMKNNKDKAMEYLDEAGEALRGKGVTVTAKVSFGSPCEEIFKAAEEIKADLIAISAHGRSGYSGWPFGSVTDKVLRRGGGIPITLVGEPNYRR